MIDEYQLQPARCGSAISVGLTHLDVKWNLVDAKSLYDCASVGLQQFYSFDQSAVAQRVCSVYILMISTNPLLVHWVSCNCDRTVCDAAWTGELVWLTTWLQSMCWAYNYTGIVVRWQTLMCIALHAVIRATKLDLCEYRSQKQCASPWSPYEFSPYIKFIYPVLLSVCTICCSPYYNFLNV